MDVEGAVAAVVGDDVFGESRGDARPDVVAGFARAQLLDDQAVGVEVEGVEPVFECSSPLDIPGAGDGFDFYGLFRPFAVFG